MLLRYFFCTCVAIGSLHTAFTKTFDIEVLSQTPRIFLVHNFLTNAECDYMIRAGRPQLRRSLVVDEQGNKLGKLHDARTSRGMFFEQNGNDPMIRGIEQRIAQLTSLPKKNGEAIQLLYYGVGGEYQPHWDYFNLSTPGGAACFKRGGQRLATCIMYLHSTPKGGETIFPKVNVSVQPKKGDAVLFYNCLPDGTTDPLSLHGGAPVIEGEKWIATKWIRAGTFK